MLYVPEAIIAKKRGIKNKQYKQGQKKYGS